MTKERLLELINGCCPYNERNGIIATDVGPNRATVEKVLDEYSLNPNGSVHGGLLFSMCDVAAGIATDNEKADSVTQSGGIYFVRPAGGKSLRAEANVVKRGRTVSYVEVEVFNDSGLLVAKAQFQYYTVNLSKAERERMRAMTLEKSE